MWTAVHKFIIRWLKSQFHHNPLVEQPAEYLSKTATAFQVWLIVVVVLIVLGFIGSIVFVIGSLKNWF